MFFCQFRERHKILKSSVAECDSTFLLAVVVTMHAAAAAIIFWFFSSLRGWGCFDYVSVRPMWQHPTPTVLAGVPWKPATRLMETLVGVMTLARGLYRTVWRASWWNSFLFCFVFVEFLLHYNAVWWYWCWCRFSFFGVSSGDGWVCSRPLSGGLLQDPVAVISRNDFRF